MLFHYRIVCQKVKIFFLILVFVNSFPKKLDFYFKVCAAIQPLKTSLNKRKNVLLLQVPHANPVPHKIPLSKVISVTYNNSLNSPESNLASHTILSLRCNLNPAD